MAACEAQGDTKTAAEGGPEKLSAGAPGLEGAGSNDRQKVSICKGFGLRNSSSPTSHRGCKTYLPGEKPSNGRGFVMHPAPRYAKPYRIRIRGLPKAQCFRPFPVGRPGYQARCDYGAGPAAAELRRVGTAGTAACRRGVGRRRRRVRGRRWSRSSRQGPWSWPRASAMVGMALPVLTLRAGSWSCAPPSPAANGASLSTTTRHRVELRPPPT